MSDTGISILMRLTVYDRMLIEQIRLIMETYFATDLRRISHALDVAEHVTNLLQYVAADPLVTIAAGYLHDIGIPEAERKYGRCDGKLQEQEGPPVARMLLADIGADETLIRQVCELIGCHHTPRGLDTPEFRVLWDADALVNLAEVVGGKKSAAVEAIIAKLMLTEPGYQMAKKLYLPSADLR